jgi:hypothetical protein
MIERYRIGDEQQPSLDRQRSVGKVGDLEDSLAACHMLIEKSVAAGNYALANNLLVTAGKLAKEVEQQKIRRAEYIRKDDAYRFAFRLGECVAEELEARGITDYEVICDAIMARWGVAARETILQLSHEEHHEPDA